LQRLHHARYDLNPGQTFIELLKLINWLNVWLLGCYIQVEIGLKNTKSSSGKSILCNILSLTKTIQYIAHKIAWDRGINILGIFGIDIFYSFIVIRNKIPDA